MNEGGLDKALSTQSLTHALAYKNNSAQLFSDAVNQVKIFTDRNTDIFPPKGFPYARHPEPFSSIQTAPHSDFVGRLQPPEAAGIVVLLNETSALAQSFGRDFETQRKLREVMQLESDEWPHDVFEGMGDFGDWLGTVSEIRERVVNHEGRPEGKTNGDESRRYMWDRFEQPIREDGLILGKHTAEAIVKSLGEQVEEHIPHIPEGARNLEEIQARIKSRKHGLRLASDLYLETLGLASTVLPTELGPKIIEETSPLLSVKK